MTRINLSVPESFRDGEQAALLRVRAESQSPGETGISSPVSHTGFMHETVSRVNSFALPLTIAVSFFAPNVESIRRRVRSGTSTALSAPYLVDVADEATWNIVLEHVTEAEVAALKDLWALPYPGPIETDFRLLSD